jgi:putative SOS response-associated peptidase YedK
MCYFVEQNIQRKELEKRFGVIMPEDPRYTPGYFYSAFSRPFLPVITLDKPGEIQVFQWGLIPFWVRDKDTAEKIRNGNYNAKSETAWEKPSFRSSIKSKRCLILTHGFFEYHTSGQLKIPHYIKLKNNQVFALAGLFDRWIDPATGEILDTFSILTTTANPMMEKIHNLKKRMPVILSKENEMGWIGESLSKTATDLYLKPFPEEQMSAYTVSKKITAKDIDIHDPGLIEFFDYNKNLFQ